MNHIIPQSIIYTAYFVDNPQRLTDLFSPRHPHVHAHHSTIEFKPQDLGRVVPGRTSHLKILGRATDEKGDALLVESALSENRYPHITLSCADGVAPFYSNGLIEKAYADGTLNLFTEPILIEVTEGYVATDSKAPHFGDAPLL